jgi:F-type H+-transporting ATPase subunit epsilon
MSAFTLSVVTPEGKIFEGPVESVSVPGTEGSFGVLNRHAPLVSRLSKGVIRIVKDGKELFYAISPGIFEVNHKSECLLLTGKDTFAESLSAAKELSV